MKSAASRPASGKRAVNSVAWAWYDWQWGCVRQRPRLRRLAGARPQADLDWGSHHSRQDIEAWQLLPARPVRPGGVGCAEQAKELGAPRAQALARGGQEASCTTTCSPSRSPTSWRASPGAFSLVVETSRRGKSRQPPNEHAMM